jgi:hypothetical protein
VSPATGKRPATRDGDASHRSPGDGTYGDGVTCRDEVRGVYRRYGPPAHVQGQHRFALTSLPQQTARSLVPHPATTDCRHRHRSVDATATSTRAESGLRITEMP